MLDDNFQEEKVKINLCIGLSNNCYHTIAIITMV
jgi:hypothetical protein